MTVQEAVLDHCIAKDGYICLKENHGFVQATRRLRRWEGAEVRFLFGLDFGRQSELAIYEPTRGIGVRTFVINRTDLDFVFPRLFLTVSRFYTLRRRLARLYAGIVHWVRNHTLDRISPPENV